MRDKSLQEIDILKLLIYGLSFVSVCTALILFLLLPLLKTHKQQSLKDNSQTAILENFRTKLQVSRDKIFLLRSENNTSLDQFEKSFNLSNFTLFLQKYFKNLEIKEEKIIKNKYLKHSLIIQGQINSPKNFYDFIDAAKNFESFIKIDYPLILKAQKDAIAFSFRVKIYSAFD
ncbi:hypothetical protein OQH60_03135 [Campylobacter sp. MIT 21-1685]|uniref:hypothetical protein n=1 Tax=unclassified Campylobacter TaxID=2593542 RepID=UPI00224AEED0|nr:MULTISPECIES: hypothetical protein [unclassified Campylobacter]MCX2682860.1 hypothetical protein [Campylobacter sp. MIT 21-1684]MCX2751192.1 hypothetical protein [Campylobacter sp. MIT 21-1682]MCX2807341.1 hypothetical protein [Campylobacter sp. MIT 21-1685]